MKRMVLVVRTNNNFFPSACSNADICDIYKSNSFVSRIVRKVILKWSFPLEKLIFTDWVTRAGSADEIIIFDSGNAADIVRFLNRRFPDKRIIMWYWNSVADSVHPNQFRNLKVELWTFDPADAKKYQLKLNTQFYIRENFRENSIESIDGADVFYIGADKNRAKTLAELIPYFKKYDISYNFNLVSYRGSTNSFGIEYKPSLSYQEVVNNIRGSKAIVDLVADWQTGLTLRPLEAIVLKKKIITNMVAIQKEPFYNKQNIFILGKDDLDTIGEFIRSEFDSHNHNEYVAFYSFESWLERFQEED